MTKKWIKKAVKRKGRIFRYLGRVYGNKAFTKSGEVKQQYVNKAIRRIKHGKGRNKQNLLQALYLARRFERFRKDR